MPKFRWVEGFGESAKVLVNAILFSPFVLVVFELDSFL